MRHLHLQAIGLVIALLPAWCHATYSLDNVTATCSESLTVLRSDDLSFQCTGDLSVSGDGDSARLLADRSVSLSATGRLSVDRLNIVSPEIQLSAGASVDIGRGVVLFTPERDPNRQPLVRVISGNVGIRPELTPSAGILVTQNRSDLIIHWTAFDVSSGSNTVNVRQGPSGLALVPEPGAWLLSLAGIAGVALTQQAKRKPRC